MLNGKRCKGTNRSAIGKTDWLECPSCAASGYEGHNLCQNCRGDGWILQTR